MKRLIGLVLLLSGTAQAGLWQDMEKKMMEDKYILPCAVVIGGGMLAGEDILKSSSVCGGFIAYDYISDKNKMDKEDFKKQLIEFRDQTRKEIIKNNEVTKKNYSEYRDSIRELVLDEFDKQNEKFFMDAKKNSPKKKGSKK